MKPPKVTFHPPDTLWITSQTGQLSDFYEVTLTVSLEAWEQLKKNVEKVLASEMCCGVPLTADGHCALSGELIRKEL